MDDLRADGTIVMRATGYEGSWHWTVARSFSPDAADYGFWRWVVAQRDRWTTPPFLSSDDLSVIRREYDDQVA